jgi:hypothetical protein
MRVLQTNSQRWHVKVVFIIYLFIYYLFIIYLCRVIPHSEGIRTSRFRKFAVSTEEPQNVTRTLLCTGLSELFDNSNRSLSRTA